MSNIDTSNIPIEIKEKCCILNDNITLKNTIQSQTAEIGMLIQERNAYKNLYEDLLNLLYTNTNFSLIYGNTSNTSNTSNL